MFASETLGATLTHSPLKAWFLATFCGQQVVNRWYRPLFSCAIFTIYLVRWELLPTNSIV